MELQALIKASSAMLPSLVNIQAILVMRGDKALESSETKVKTNTHFNGFALVNINNPSEVKGLSIELTSTVKGIKGKPHLNVRSSLILSLNDFEAIKQAPSEEKLDVYLGILFRDLAHLQTQLLFKTDLRVKQSSEAYSRLLGNQTYGSSLIIPSKDEFKEKMAQLTEVERDSIEASTQICNSFSDHLYHIFNDLYLNDTNNRLAA